MSTLAPATLLRCPFNEVNLGTLTHTCLDFSYPAKALSMCPGIPWPILHLSFSLPARVLPAQSTLEHPSLCQSHLLHPIWVQTALSKLGYPSLHALQLQLSSPVLSEWRAPGLPTPMSATAVLLVCSLCREPWDTPTLTQLLPNSALGCPTRAPFCMESSGLYQL